MYISLFQQKFVGPKKYFWIQKNLVKKMWSKKFGPIRFGSKMVDLTKSWSKLILPPKILGQKNFGSKNIGSKKFWIQKNVVENILD